MLPIEILSIIFAYCGKNTLTRLSLCSSQFKELAQPILYRSIKLNHGKGLLEHTKKFFRTLAANGALASQVIRLSINLQGCSYGMTRVESRDLAELLKDSFAGMDKLVSLRFEGMFQYDGSFFQSIKSCTIKSFKTDLPLCLDALGWLARQQHLERLEASASYFKINRAATILGQEPRENTFKNLTSIMAPVVTVASIVTHGQPSLETIHFTYDEPTENGAPDLDMNEMKCILQGRGPLKKLVFHLLVNEDNLKMILQELSLHQGSTLETLSVLVPYFPEKTDGRWDEISKALKKLTALRYLYLPDISDTVDPDADRFLEMCREACPKLIELQDPDGEGVGWPKSSDEE